MSAAATEPSPSSWPRVARRSALLPARTLEKLPELVTDDPERNTREALLEAARGFIAAPQA